MRLISIVTAILVMVSLYFLVIERDRLIAFASRDGETAAETAVAEGVKTEAAPSGEPLRKVSVVAFKSTAQPVKNAVLLRGQTEAARQVLVQAETSGRVISEPLRKGAEVQEGQVLCEIDPGTRKAALADSQAGLIRAQAQLPEARARLAEAEARLAEAEINDRAAARLSEGGYASETRVASAKAAVESARAGVQAAKAGVEASKSGVISAEARVQVAQKEIERLRVLAPFSGLLETDTAELGSLMQPGAACATIIQLDPIKLVGFAPETEIDKLAVGALAGARLASGREVTGRVTFLSRSADATTRTFRTEVEVENSDRTIRDGQTVEIIIASADARAHLLPASSLTLNNDGILGVRLVTEDNRAKFSPVSVLRDTIDGVWLTGLPEQASVIVSGQEFVSDGVTMDVTYRGATE